MSLAAVGQGIVMVAVVIVLVFWVLVAVVVARLVRAVRRRYRRVRVGLLPMSVMSKASSSAGRDTRRGLTAASVGSSDWWVVQRDRRRIWRAVTAAEHAVRVAQDAGAPVGDLPALTSQLTTAAHGLDALVRASGQASASRRDVIVERDRIVATAADIQRAAVDSLSAMVDADTDPLMSAVRVEVTALATGVRSAGYRPGT